MINKISLPIKGKKDASYTLHPTKIICMGRNYSAHARELGNDPPEEPLFFVKTPTCLIASGQPIIMPGIGTGIKRVDHEIELAVIIGTSTKDVTEDDAMKHVLGYTIFNDVTARDLQKVDIESKKPWFRSKNFDTFGPIGPALVLKEDLNPSNLQLVLKVNGETRQDANTREMIFSIPEIISFVSSFMTLEEGDIIATGTPQGISPIVGGDVVEAIIEPIGILKNRVNRDP
ncbi:MAG: fumarylacetoacetate hydrolase family protein [Promethearchaeota archaeon]